MLSHGNLRSPTSSRCRPTRAGRCSARRREPRRAADVPHLRAERPARPQPLRRRLGRARRALRPGQRPRLDPRPRHHARGRRATDVPVVGEHRRRRPGVDGDGPPRRLRAPRRSRPRSARRLRDPVRQADLPGLRPDRGVADGDVLGHRRRAEAGLDRPPAARRRGPPRRRGGRGRAARRSRGDLGPGTERVRSGTGRTRPRPAAPSIHDGWLRTGDVAVADDDGYLYIVDRAKDLIIVSGFNVYPAEVEEALLEHPGIAGVAVVGVPAPALGRDGEGVRRRRPPATTSRRTRSSSSAPAASLATSARRRSRSSRSCRSGSAASCCVAELGRSRRHRRASRRPPVGTEGSRRRITR